MALSSRRRYRPVDYWPGFVDALSTLILGIIFLLTVFMVVQFFLSQEVAGKDTALSRLNQQIAQLGDHELQVRLQGRLRGVKELPVDACGAVLAEQRGNFVNAPANQRGVLAGDRGLLMYKLDTKQVLFQRSDEVVELEVKP